jgi:uncharacterized protein YaaN involved in tellurite resistance
MGSERYKEILEEYEREFLGSEIYQDYLEFARSLQNVNLSFEEYEDILNETIKIFEEEHIHEDQYFDDLQPRVKRQLLINAGETLGILK